jgi:hypothetical protein
VDSSQKVTAYSREAKYLVREAKYLVLVNYRQKKSFVMKNKVICNWSCNWVFEL